MHDELYERERSLALHAVLQASQLAKAVARDLATETAVVHRSGPHREERDFASRYLCNVKDLQAA